VGEDGPAARPPSGGRPPSEPRPEPAAGEPTAREPEPDPEAPGERGPVAGVPTGPRATGSPHAPPPPTGHRPLTSYSPFAIGFFGAVGVIVALALRSVLEAASSVVLLVVVALFLAVGLNPAIEALMRRGVRRGIAVTVVLVAVVASLALFGAAIVPVISDQVAAIVEATPRLIDQLQNNTVVARLNERFDLLDRVREQVVGGGVAEQLAGGALGFGLAVLGALANTLIVLILTLYFLVSLPRIKRTGYLLVPASRRERVAALTEEILRGVGGYVSGAFVVALTAGVTSLVFLFVVGLGEYAVALAFLVALFDLVPLIGATIGAVIVSAIGLAEDPTIGIACAIFYVVYQQVENYVIYPRVMASQAAVPGALTVIAVLAGGTLLGIIGALLAIPTAAALLLLMREVVVRRQDAR
jgi:predicted PurR-regulated permease PerM